MWQRVAHDKIFTMKSIIRLLVVAILFSSSVVKADSLNKATMYYGVHYYSYIERTTEYDPFMELKSQIPTFTLGLRDESAIRSENSTNKFSYLLIWFFKRNFSSTNLSAFSEYVDNLS